MNEIVLNWARARKGIYVLYIFILVLPVSMGLLQKSISIFLAPSLAFSIIFYYLHARVRLAEAERWSIAPNASTADFFSLFSKLIGGLVNSLFW